MNKLALINPDGTNLRLIEMADDPLKYSVATVAWRPAVRAATAKRVSDADRIGTAVAISRESFAAGAADAVVLSRHDAFPDAVTGGPLAVAKNGPLLLTPSAVLDRRVSDEIRRVVRPGGTVYLLGSATSLNASVEAAARTLGYRVVRLAGADRYETSVLIAREIGTPSMVLLATGLNFPDALTAGPAAGQGGGAVLLTSGASLSPAVRTYLDERGPTITLYAVGGQAAAAYPQAKAKLAGENRYHTAVLVARQFFGPRALVGLASGENFPDALAAGPLLARASAPLLLTTPQQLPISMRVNPDQWSVPTTRDYLFQVGSAVDRLMAFGGPPSVSDAVLKHALDTLN